MSTGPLYERLSHRLAALCRDGDLAAGARLPSERSLAADLAVSRGTVVAAYGVLAERGVVDRVQGSGTVVRAGAGATRVVLGPGSTARVMDPGVAPRDDRAAATIVDLGPAHVDCSPVVREEMALLSGDPRIDEITDGHGYEPAGLPALRAAIAADYRAQGLAVDAHQVVITTGGQQGLSLLAGCLIEPGDAVVTESATYFGALDAFQAAGARIFGARSDSHGVDPEDLARVVARVRPSAVYLTSCYGNPSGALLSPERRRAVVRMLAEAGVPLIDDRITARLSLGRAPAGLMATEPGAGEVITLDSLSKVAWGGLRVGWTVTSPGLARSIARARMPADLGGPMLSQLLALRLLPRMDEMVVGRVVQLRRHLSLLTDALDRHLPSWSPPDPDGGTTLWVRLPSGSATAFAEVALRAGVRVVPGPTMSVGDGFDDHIRMSFSRPEHDLAVGAQRLALAWRRFDPHHVAVEPALTAVL